MWEGAMFSQARHKGGDTVDVIDETLHQVVEAVHGAKLQGRPEDHVRRLEVQLGLEQRSQSSSLVW